MSHFVVLVPAEDRAELERKLLPYHEYECTGIKEYIEWIDETTEVLEGWKNTSNRDKYFPNRLMLPGGHTFNGFSDAEIMQFVAMYKEDREKFTKTVTKFEGKQQEFEEFISSIVISEPYHVDPNQEALDKFAEEYYGYEKNAEGQYGQWTNPNAKWDWWVIGGRWTGLLFPDYDPREDPENWNFCSTCNGTGDRFGWVTYKPDPENAGKRLRTFTNEWAEKCNGCNTCRGKGVTLKYKFQKFNGDSPFAQQIPWNKIREKEFKHHVREWKIFHDGLEYVKENNIEMDLDNRKAIYTEKGPKGDNIRSAFNTLEDYLLFSLTSQYLHKESEWFFHETFDKCAQLFYSTEEEYKDIFKNKAFTYAFIDTDGNWNQRGKMGWFGMSDENQGTDDYDERFWEFVNSLAPEQRLYVVDCHI